MCVIIRELRLCGVSLKRKIAPKNIFIQTVTYSSQRCYIHGTIYCGKLIEF